MSKKKIAKKRTRTTPSNSRRPVAIEDLSRIRVPSSARFSPDGRCAVYVEKSVGDKNNYETRIYRIDDLDASRPGVTPLTRGPRDSNPRWSPDGRQLALVRSEQVGQPQIHLLPLDGGEARPLTRFPEGTLASYEWAPNGKFMVACFRETAPEWSQQKRDERKDSGASDPPVIVERDVYRLDGDGVFNDQRFHLYTVDIDTGEHRVLYDKSPEGTYFFDIAPHSKEIILVSNRAKHASRSPWKSQLLRLPVTPAGQPHGKAIAVPLPDGVKSSPRYSPDGKQIAFAGKEGKEDLYGCDNLDLFFCDLRGDQLRNLTAAHDHCLLALAFGDIVEPSFAAWFRFAEDGESIYYRLGHEGSTQLVRVSLTGEMRALIDGVPADYEFGNCRGDNEWIATSSRVDRLPEVVVLAPHKRSKKSSPALQPRPVTTRNAQLQTELELASVATEWATALDGHHVQYWVMRPVKRSQPSSRKTPAILEIHGGPHAAYGYPFYFEFQLLAARGYTVYYSNPRGSKSYGREHCSAIRQNWGSVDWLDIQAVRDAMKRDPHVDTKKLGVMGGSYGGYMTNWAISHCDDFAAAITDRCVANLMTLVSCSDFMVAPDREFPGNTWDRTEEMWKQSPLRYFGNVNTPTLIIHSEGDLRCNIEQAEQIHTALRLRDIRTRFVRYPRSCSHGLSRGGPPDMRMHRLQEICDWWNEFL